MKNRLSLLILAASLCHTAQGEIHLGDINHTPNMGDIFIGDTPQTEFAASSPSGSIAQLVSDGRAEQATRISPTIVGSSANPAVAAAREAASLVKSIALGLPGAALDASYISPVLCTNARIISTGTNQRLPGYLLANNIKNLLSLYPTSTEIFTGTGSTSATVASTTARLVPILFITISASLLNTRVGARITLTWPTAANKNFSFLSLLRPETDVWTIERLNANEAVNIALIPYKRIKDTIVPLSLIDNGTDHVVVDLAGLDGADAVSGVFPGIDSAELSQFMQAWNLRF